MPTRLQRAREGRVTEVTMPQVVPHRFRRRGELDRGLLDLARRWNEFVDHG
jgi:hypothetical protein